VNSLGCDLRIWDEIVTEISDRPILRYDKRGHGLSDCPPSPYTIAEHANDLADLLAHLAINRAVLVGISVGGMIAMEYARQHPDTLDALVLSDTATRIGTSDLWNQRIATLRENGMAYLGEAILDRWFAPDFARQRPADFRGYLNMLNRMPVEGYTATCEAIRDAQLESTPAHIHVRTIVIGGEQDLATPPAAVQALAESLPNARFQLIKDAAHLPCIERPQEFSAAITEFLKEKPHVE
jgi:3-oxoadipate enol-lactonase